MFTEPEAIAFVSLISGLDSRFQNDKPTRSAWAIAARDGRWDFESACLAVRKFYSRPLEANESLPRIAPGHVTKQIRTLRPGGDGPRPAREILALSGPGGSTAAHRSRLREEFAARQEASRAARGVKARSRIKPRTPAPEPVERAGDEAAGRRAVEALLGRGGFAPEGPATAFGGRS